MLWTFFQFDLSILGLLSFHTITFQPTKINFNQETSYLKLFLQLNLKHIISYIFKEEEPVGDQSYKAIFTMSDLLCIISIDNIYI